MRSVLLAASLLLTATAASAQPAPPPAAAPPVASAPAARPALIASTSPSAFAAALQRAGFTAEVKTEDGQTYVLGHISAVPFQAFLSHCQPNGAGCTDVELYAGFTGTTHIAWERLNGWNARTRFGRAFLDEHRDPALQMDLSLQGGVSRDSLNTSLETWGSALETFSLFLIAPAAQGSPTSGAGGAAPITLDPHPASARPKG